MSIADVKAHEVTPYEFAVFVGLVERTHRMLDFDPDLRPYGARVMFNDGSDWIDAFGSGSHHEPLAHSECVAIANACEIRGDLLHGCTLFSTHEPCVMCIGAINHAKVNKVIFGSYREDLPHLYRARAYSWQALLADTSHPPIVIGGVYREACIALLENEVRG